MPIEWGLLAAKAAVSAAVGLPLKKAVDGVEKLFQRGKLSDELATAYRAAFEAFERTLSMVSGRQLDEATSARLAAMFDDADRPDQIWQLPYRAELESLSDQPSAFSAMLAGIPADDIGAAWRALVRTFHQQIASKEKLSRLVSHAQAGRQEDLLAEIRGLLELHFDRDDPTDIAAWREALAKRLRFADTSGLFWREKERPNEGIELREIFVETLLRRDVRERRAKETDAVADDLRFELPERPRRPSRDIPAPEPQTIADVLRAERHVVILGPPGSGKSTLARCLTLSLAVDDAADRPLESGLPAETVPIRLELKAFASRLGQEPTLKLDAWIAEVVGKDLANLGELLEAGRALLLLDGLDEVFDEAHRRWVSEEVWRLLTRYDRARYVLTSRPHGYWAAPLAGPVPVFEMVAFDEERIGRFFRGWFGALYRIGVDAGAHDAPPEKRAAELTQDILERDRLRSLAENPMLCTLIVLVHRSRSNRLPERRVDFYEAAVSTLLETWEQRKRSPKQPAPLEFPEPRFLRQVLSEVAWRAMTELGGREIPAGLLKEWLEVALSFDAEWVGKRGKRAVDDFLQVVNERTGLLTDAGGDRYQFLHLSLQEYLVARYLLDRLNESQRNTAFRHFIHARGWEEILRHTAARAEPVIAEQLIEAVLAEPTSDLEGRIQRDLRFVCRCLGDRTIVDKKLLAGVRRRLAAALCDLEVLDRPGLVRDGAGAGNSPAIQEAIRQLLAKNEPELQDASIEFLAQVGVGDPETENTLLKILTNDFWRALEVAPSLFTLIAQHPKTRAVLLQLLDDQDPNTRAQAIRFLGAIGTDDSEIENAIRRRLADEDADIRLMAAEFFTAIAAHDNDISKFFLQQLANADPCVRASACDFFFSMEQIDREARTGILQRLVDESPSVRISAIWFFLAHEDTETEARNALIQRLADEEPTVRMLALKSLVSLGTADTEIKDAAAKGLADENPSVRASAISFFTHIRANDAPTRSAVLQRLVDESAAVRHSAIVFLAECADHDAETLGALLGQVTDEDVDTRHAATQLLARIGTDNTEARNALLQRLADQDHRIRNTAVRFFVRIGVDNTETKKTFLQYLSDDNPHLRNAATHFFTLTGTDEGEVRDALRARLMDCTAEVRQQALEFFLTWRVVTDSWQQLLECFERTHTGMATPQLNRELCTLLGQLAADEPRLLQRLLGLQHPHLDLAEALRSLALSRDDARRRSTHLTTLLG